jgi:hypothetical protein
VGSRTDPVLLDLLAKIHGRFLPNKTLIVTNGDEKGSEHLPEPAKGKTTVNGKATAYVCHSFTCSQPVTDWPALEKLLQ